MSVATFARVVTRMDACLVGCRVQVQHTGANVIACRCICLRPAPRHAVSRCRQLYLLAKEHPQFSTLLMVHRLDRLTSGAPLPALHLRLPLLLLMRWLRT